MQITQTFTFNAFTFAFHTRRHTRYGNGVSAARPAALYADGARASNKAVAHLKIKCLHCVHRKTEYSVRIADQNVPRGLSREAGTQTLDAGWKSLKCWLPQTANKKGKVKSVKATRSAKLEMRVWQWVFRREKLCRTPAENVKVCQKQGACVNAAASGGA